MTESVGRGGFGRRKVTVTRISFSNHPGDSLSFFASLTA